MSADRLELERYLHEHIPLCKCVQVAVDAASDTEVTLSAPFRPNINHRDTVFAGSASALAILSGWTLLYMRLRALPFPVRIVIQRNHVEYRKPILGRFCARCRAPNAEQWGRFMNALGRKKRARISLHAELRADGVVVGTFEGDYVALRAQAGARPAADGGRGMGRRRGT